MVSVVSVSAEEFPLPADVHTAPRWFALMMGAQPVRAAGLQTALSPEQAQAFYEKALAKQGWTVQPVPWLEQAQKQRAAMEQTLKEHPEVRPDAAQQKQLDAMLSPDNMERFRAAAAQQVYAVRGAEHALIAFNSSGERTVLAISRWEGESKAPLGVPESPPGLAAPAAVPAWPAANPCCGEGVPSGLRQVPSRIPAYPNGRMISSGTSAQQGGRGIATETYLTADSSGQVAEFYHRHMAYNGWTELERPVSWGAQQQVNQFLGEQAGQFAWKTLTFQDDHGMCTIVVTEYRGAVPLGTSPLGELIAGSQGSASSGNERTVIGINYLESPGLGRKASTEATGERVR